MRLSNGEVLLAWPLAQHIITQGWFYNDGSMHRAIDLRTQIGNTSTQPVYAAEGGTVDQVQNWDGHTKTGMQSYGNMVRIKHSPYKGGVLQTRYAHLSRYCVKLGQQVKEGDLIGYSGTTGNVFGAHLHFEVILNGSRTNPLVWLDNDFTTASGQVFTYRPGEHAVEKPADAAQTAKGGVPGIGPETDPNRIVKALPTLDKPAEPTHQEIWLDHVVLPNAAAMEFYAVAKKYGLDNDKAYHAKFVEE